MFFAIFVDSLHSSLKEQLPLSQRNVILGIQLVTKTNHELLMCAVKLVLWILNGTRHAMPFAVPVIWKGITDHILTAVFNSSLVIHIKPNTLSSIQIHPQLSDQYCMASDYLVLRGGQDQEIPSVMK
jgi:hypothetical protein